MSVLEGIALPASFLVFPYCSRFQYPLPAAYPPPQMPLAAPGRAAQCWDCLGCSFQLQSLCLNLLVLPPSRSCENRQPSPKSQYPLWYTSEAPEKSVKSGATGSIWRDFARIRATQCPPGTCGLESPAWATFWLIWVCGPLLLLTRAGAQLTTYQQPLEARGIRTHQSARNGAYRRAAQGRRNPGPGRPLGARANFWLA